MRDVQCGACTIHEGANWDKACGLGCKPLFLSAWGSSDDKTEKCDFVSIRFFVNNNFLIILFYSCCINAFFVLIWTKRRRGTRNEIAQTEYDSSAR